MAIDEQALTQLRALDAKRPGLLSRVVSRYRVTAGETLDGMRDARARGDAETLCNLAHRLKGDSLFLGAVHVADCASELERRAKDGDVKDAAAAWAALEQALACALEQLLPLEAEALQKGESPTTESGQA